MLRPSARLALCLALGGCSNGEPQLVNVYAPYAGDPVYPSRRPKIDLPSGEVGLISNNGSDTVTVVDLADLSMLGAAPVGRSPVDNDGPHHLAANREGGFVYVADVRRMGRHQRCLR